MHTPESNIIELLRKTIPLLEKAGIDYWLGRGVLRHWTLKKEIGVKQSDLDFHIWEKDKNILEKLSELFTGYKAQSRSYKLAFIDREGQSQIEFMYLRSFPTDPSLVYHERDYGKYKFYFPTDCVLSFKTIEIAGIKVRIPMHIERYMVGLYGPNWKKENKDDKHTNPFINKPQQLLKYLDGAK